MTNEPRAASWSAPALWRFGTNGGSARALAWGCQRPRWKHRRAEMGSTRASNPTAGGGCAPHGWNHSFWETVFGATPKMATGTVALPSKDPIGGRAPAPAKGSLGWTNGAKGV